MSPAPSAPAGQHSTHNVVAGTAPLPDGASTTGSLVFLPAELTDPYIYNYRREDGPMDNLVEEHHTVQISSARPLAEAGQLSLDVNGFKLVNGFTTALEPDDFQDDSKVTEVYFPEVEQLVRAQFPDAQKVVIFDQTKRTDVKGDGRDPGQRAPVMRVHSDQTPPALANRVREHTGAEAPEWLKGRSAIVNIWRPIRGPLVDRPLALADASSVEWSDLVPAKLIYREKVGEIFMVKYSPQHRWYYVPTMGVDEVVLIKCADSKPGVARATPHTAFEDPATAGQRDQPGWLPRASIEVRALVLWGEANSQEGEATAPAVSG